MSGSRDYRDEMYAQRELDDATVEAVLRGGSVPTELEPLAEAFSALRALPGQPVRPSAELAARMATGDFASAVAPRPSRRSAGRHAARRRLATVPLPVKVAAGGVLALAGLASATAAGALPEPAQHGVERVIETVTPFEFGRDVSDDAKDGGVDGEEISDDARDQGNRPDDAGSDGSAPAVKAPTQDVDEPANWPAKKPPGTKPENPGGAEKPNQPDQPDRESKPTDTDQPGGAGKPDAADRPKLPVEPRDTD